MMLNYSDQFLVDRLFENLSIRINNGTKTTITKPNITRLNKKTYITNFQTVCESMNRNMEIVRNYFEKSLALNIDDVTINSMGELIITGSHTDNNLMSHLTKYINTYVICSQKGCKSKDTELIKENRMLWFVCKKCNSKKTIND